MTNLTSHERPGIYSAYEATSFVAGRNAGAAVGMAVLCQQGDETVVSRIYSSEDAKTAFGAESLLCEMITLALRNGASEVAAVPVKSTAGYEAALGLLGETENLSILLCDTEAAAVQQTLKSTVETVSALRRERIGVLFGAATETVSNLLARAAGLNSERLVLVAPAAEGVNGGARLAAAVAGAIAGERDPAVPLGGAALLGLDGLTQSYSEETLDALIRGGVTVAERVGSETSVVRGVTTRTKTGGNADSTWRELSTIRILDDVIPTVRNSLRSRFTRSKNTQQVRSAIRSQVVLELAAKCSQEIITSYGQVNVQAMESDPSVCLVEFSFTVSHGINQIWLSAKITV